MTSEGLAIKKPEIPSFFRQMKTIEDKLNVFEKQRPMLAATSLEWTIRS